MRRIALLVVCLGLALAACGDKGSGGGVVGAWVIDVDQVLSAMLKEQEAQMAKALAEAPAEQREMMKSLMPTGDKLRDTIREQLGKMEGVIEFRADGTASMSMEGGEKSEKGEGTWTQKGETVTLTPTTKNGQPVSGGDAETVTLTFKDGRLSLKPDPDAPLIQLKRK